jgi:hypothetical protein
VLERLGGASFLGYKTLEHEKESRKKGRHAFERKIASYWLCPEAEYVCN